MTWLEFDPHSSCPLRICELKDPGGPIARQAFAIYEQSFPEEERDSIDNLAATIYRQAGPCPPRDRVDHFWAALNRQTVVGLAIFNYYREPRLAFFRYLAVREADRGRGYGAALFRRVVAQLPKDAAALAGLPPLGVCFEVERPEDAADEAGRRIRCARLRFYRRLGVQQLEGVNFVAPPLRPGLPAMPYHLMFCRAGPAEVPLTPALQREIVTTVLVKGYKLLPESPYVQQAIAGLGQVF